MGQFDFGSLPKEPSSDSFERLAVDRPPQTPGGDGGVGSGGINSGGINSGGLNSDSGSVILPIRTPIRPNQVTWEISPHTLMIGANISNPSSNPPSSPPTLASASLPANDRDPVTDLLEKYRRIKSPPPTWPLDAHNDVKSHDYNDTNKRLKRSESLHGQPHTTSASLSASGQYSHKAPWYSQGYLQRLMPSASSNTLNTDLRQRSSTSVSGALSENLAQLIEFAAEKISLRGPSGLQETHDMADNPVPLHSCTHNSADGNTESSESLPNVEGLLDRENPINKLPNDFQDELLLQSTVRSHSNEPGHIIVKSPADPPLLTRSSPSPMTSDYGLDDDLDLDLWDSITLKIKESRNHNHNQSERPKQSPIEAVKSQSLPLNLQQKPSTAPDSPISNEDLLLSDDLEEFIKQFEMPATESSPVKASPSKSLPIKPNSQWTRNLSKCFKAEDQTRNSRFSDNEQVQLKTVLKHPNLLRFVVVSVAQSVNSQEMELEVMNAENITRKLILKDSWTEAPPETGDLIHIVNADQRSDMINSSLIVDNKHGLLIVHPDIMVSCTSVAEAFVCKRRVVLRERLRDASGDISKPMVLGNIIHELIQHCLIQGDFRRSVMITKINELVTDFIEDLIICHETAASAIEELTLKIPCIQQWKSLYVRPSPTPRSIAIDHRGGEKHNLSISKVNDIEEEIWSPIYGIKGKVDATVEVNTSGIGKHIAPLEIKSSKWTKSISHRAQTSLYTLLLTERYDVEVKFGLLYFSETGELIRVPVLHDEIRALMLGRNEMVRYLKSMDRRLPPVIKDEFTCGRCVKKTQCMIYHNSLEGGTELSSGLDQDYSALTGHLTENHKVFFNHWDDLLSKEESDIYRYLKEVWTMTSLQRESVGRCYGRLSLKFTQMETRPGTSQQLYVYVLERAGDDKSPLNFVESQMISGDPIVVSDESGHVCLTTGFLRFANRNTITIAVKHRLTNYLNRLKDFDENKNHSFSSMVAGPETNSEILTSTIFRVDRDEFGQAMSMARNNLMHLFIDSENPRRDLIVDLTAPRFAERAEDILVHGDHFNVDQKKAIDVALRGELTTN